MAALLSASFKTPDGKYLGVKWCVQRSQSKRGSTRTRHCCTHARHAGACRSPFEAVLYVRVLAENEDFTDRLVRSFCIFPSNP